MTEPVAVNGRFLRSSPSGLHRAARGLIDAARRGGIALEVVAPAGTHDPRVDRVTWCPPGWAGEQLWEQLVLPLAARGRALLSLTNTAPLFHARNAVMVFDLATLVGPHWYAPRYRLYGRLSLAVARRARLVLVGASVMAAELASRGVRAERIFVVRPAVDEAFSPAPDHAVTALRARLDLHRPYVMLVGWGDPRKDAATAAAAHLRLAGRSEHDLVLVGGALAHFAHVDLPAAPSIRRVGALDDGDLRSLYTGASALLFPSRYEGFGFPPLEAMACGTPPIVSDIPVLRESTMGRALFVEPGDVAGWAAAIAAAVAGHVPAQPPPTWTWSDAAEQLRIALSAAGWA